MGNRLNVHQMKCIRKIPVSEGGTDKHTNIAFISEEIWRAVMTEDISETIKDGDSTDCVKIMDYYQLRKDNLTHCAS